MLIPIGTDSAYRRTPYVNYSLIGINIASYFLLDIFLPRTMNPMEAEAAKDPWVLDGAVPHLVQFFTYQFLHADFWHVAGNLLFLWVFGNAVNAKMGHVTDLLFYLACGVFAGVGFVFFDGARVLGASGAIAGVTTAFLVLFPRTGITVFYWFWLYIGTIQIRATILIVVKIILWDNVVAPGLAGETTAVAYSAHMSGYVFGFVVCAAMLMLRALPRDQYDIMALIKRRRQRQQFRSVMADPNARAQATYGRMARPVSAVTGRPLEIADEPVDDEVVALRAEIAEKLDLHDYDGAVERYEQLIARDDDQVLPRRHMLSVANQLMTAGRYAQAADAYEKFVKQYPADSDVYQIKLVLGIINAKYLSRYETAQGYLKDCLARLSNPDQVRQATHWLETASSALGRGASPA
jgi:membrane associated rhomboid family serine protease